MIKNNYIHHNQIGIGLRHKAYIYFNAIYENTLYGIKIEDNDGMDSMISYNLIENNQKYAIYTYNYSNTLSAINNYWGSDSGPEKDIVFNDPSLITFEPFKPSQN